MYLATAAKAASRVRVVGGTTVLAPGAGRFSLPNWIRLPLLTRKTTRAPSTTMPERTTSKSTNQTWPAGWPERPAFNTSDLGSTPIMPATLGR